MPSIFWNRCPEKAYRNPYDYDAQEQFVRECRVVLHKLQKLINSNVMIYRKDEYSAEKAI